MLPDILNLFFEKIHFIPNDEIITLLQNKSILNIPNFIDLLIELAFKPNSDQNFVSEEACRIIDAFVNSSSNVILLKYLFENQGPQTDKKIKTIQGNKIIKCLPLWKQEANDNLITRIILKPNGINNLVKTLAELIVTNRTSEAAFKIAACICKPREIHQNDYYKQIAVQITDLVRISKLSKIIDAKNKNNDIHKEYLKFGQCIGLESVHLYSLINKEYAMTYLLQPIFREFFEILDDNNSLCFTEPQIVIESEDLIDILSLMKSLLETHKPSLFIQSWSRRWAPILLSIAKTGIKDNINQKVIAMEILSKLIELSHKSSHDTQKFIRALCNLNPFEESTFNLNKQLEIRTSLDGQNIEIAVKCSSLYIDVGSDQDLQNLKVVIKALSCLPTLLKNDVVGDLFIWLLEHRLFLDNDGKKVELIFGPQTSDLEHSRMFRDSLLLMLCTHMESHCFSKTGDILKFAQIAILQYSKMRENPSTLNPGETLIHENLDYALNMIQWVLENGGQLANNDKNILKELFPILNNLTASYPNDKTTDFITDICTVIATNGYVNPLAQRNSLIEELDEKVDEELQKAFDAVKIDEEISYQGFGLAKLIDLLDKKNESAIKNRVKIYNIFSHYLFHKDPCIYIRAIRGLSLLVDQFTEKLLPVISKKIQACRSTSNIEEWLTLNEVYMRIIRNLGQMAPCYRDLVLNCIMPQLNDDEELIRASGVTNLGELCCQLEYAFSLVINEVMGKVCHLLENDSSAKVKVACSIMIRKLILGQIDNIKYSRPEIMMRLHSVIKMIRESFEKVFQIETNEIVLDHVSVANKCLSESIKSVPFFADISNMKISIGDSEVFCKYKKLSF